MRRYLSLILVVMFAFAMATGLVGCKKGEEAPDEQATEEVAAPAEGEEAAAPAEGEEAAAPAEAAKEEAK